MEKFSIKDLAKEAIIAAIYISLTLLLYPISFSIIQFRISEVLVLLVFFNKKHTIGITLGVLISNFFSYELGLIDVLFGTLSTFIACVLITRTKSLFIASLFPSLTSLIIVLEMVFYLNEPFYIALLGVTLPMIIIETVIGYPLFKILSKNDKIRMYLE